MQPKKPLSEYTVAGLLFVGAQTRDNAVKTAILNELRNRRKFKDLQKVAAERNRVEREKVNIELEIAGIRSKDEQERRRSNRDLFTEMKDRAFELVDIPEDLHPSEAVKHFTRDLYAKAKELYTEYKRTHKSKTLKEQRDATRAERKACISKCRAQQAAKRNERDVYRHTRFPLIGTSVYYADTRNAERQIGVICGFTYRKNICTFIAKVKGDDGLVERALSVIEPIENTEWFNEIKKSFMEFEQWEKIIKERDSLKLRVEAYERRLAVLEPVVEAYMQSDFRRDWLAADEAAKNIARNACGTEDDYTL